MNDRMNMLRRPMMLAMVAQALVGAGIALRAQAQQQAPREPHIGYVYPAGGQRGQTFQVTVGGQFLDGAREALVSGSGVKVTVVEHIKPMTPQQATMLREQLAQLRERRAASLRPAAGPVTMPAWSADDEQTFADLRRRLATFVPRPSSPAIAETVVLKITLDSDAEIGHRELRLLTQIGLSNPLVFCIGQLPEFAEDPTNNSGEPRSSVERNYMSITLPAVVNGQILAGGVDRYLFEARKGQQLVVAASARKLIPYLADAVPGWFQATLALFDPKGNEVAYVDDFRFSPDPVLFFNILRDGEYVLEVRDAIYRGREDFVYRIAMGELPFLTSVFPLGTRAGAQTSLAIKGRNLPDSWLTYDARDAQEGMVSVRTARGSVFSNQKPFAVDTTTDCFEKEPNSRPADAQELTLPIIVNGRIGQPDDCDFFRFEGRAGQPVVAEVVARRLDSPLDSRLRLTDAQGKELAFNDDHQDRSAALVTHHADSFLHFTLPADGVYILQVSDVQGSGGPEYGYRLRISPPQQDFVLRVVPSAINIRAGGTGVLTVHAIRRDGFSGEIALALKDAPAEAELGGALIPQGYDQVRLTLSVPPMPDGLPRRFRLEGRAMIDGAEVVRPVVPADEMQQAFSYRHLVVSAEPEVMVGGRGTPRSRVRLLDPTPLKIPIGSNTRIRVGVPANPNAPELKFELNQPPDGISLVGASPIPRGFMITLACDETRIRAGTKGNLIIDAYADRPPPSTGRAARGNVRRVPVGTLPAIPFEIVGP